jgi:2',3'-cyclic-nucleotide 2'-phosphodiesterase (5'-nucleotidase family)
LRQLSRNGRTAIAPSTAFSCGDTLHGTYPVLKTQGQALIPVLNSLGLDAMTAHWEFAYGPATFKQRAAELSYSCGQGPCKGLSAQQSDTEFNALLDASIQSIFEASNT